MIDTKKPIKDKSDDEISEPSQIQKQILKKPPTRKQKSQKKANVKFDIANNEEKISNSSTPIENEKLR